jgi:hypothetical protein
MDTISWKDPWYSIEGADELQEGLDAELARELPRGHALDGRPARSIARRLDNDDVLYLLDGDGPELAVVHLTWRRTRETSPSWPWTELFRNAAEFVRERMETDASEYQER